MEEKYIPEEEKINFIRIFREMWKLAKKNKQMVLLVTALIVGLFCLRAVFSNVTSYEASTSFVLSPDTSVISQKSVMKVDDKNEYTTTFPAVINSSKLQSYMASDLKRDVKETIEVTSLAGTNLFTLNVRGTDGEKALETLEAVLRNYPKVANDIIGNTTIATVDEPILPTKPTYTRSYPKEILRGLGIAAILISLYLLVYIQTHSAVKTGDDLKKMMNVSYLGSLDRIRFKKRRKKINNKVLIYNDLVPPQFLEAVRFLRTRVRRATRGQESRIIMVTSAVPNEGKTTVSANLAVSMAELNKSVLLVDGDIRNPSVAKFFDLEEQENGFEGLAKNLSVESLTQKTAHPNLEVLSVGEDKRTAMDMLEDGTLAEMIRSAVQRYDFVFVDTPPCTLLPDAMMLSSSVDGCLLVVRQDYAPTHQVLKAVGNLNDGNVPIIGSVLNMVEGESSIYQQYGEVKKPGFGYQKKAKV